jgi:hypothetical protein
LELVEEPLRQLAFGGRDVRFGDEIEMVPEGLAGKLFGTGGQEPGQRGGALPIGKAEFAGGMDGAIDGGQQQVLAHGKPLGPFGKVAIQEGDEPDLLGEVIEGDDVAEGSDVDGVGLRGLALLVPQCGGEELVGRSQVEGADDLRPAVDALAFAGIIVGVAVNDLGRKARHAVNSGAL